MTKRLVRLVLVGCVMTIGCASVRPPSIQQQSLAERRKVIERRDVGFTYDTIATLRFDPPSVYGAFKLEVEKCSGFTRDGLPRFYITNRQPVIYDYLAFYDTEELSITFGLGTEIVPWIIHHELLHWVLDGHGIKGHPAQYFGPNGKCWAEVQPDLRYPVW